MAFEDRYYLSRSFGLVTLRYRPVDETLAPAAAVLKAKEVPGHFCLAKVSVRQNYQIKRCLTVERFCEIRNVLLTELNVSVSKMEPEISRVLVMDGSMKESPHTTAEMIANFEADDLMPAFQAKRAAVDMLNAINHWQYEEGLCNRDAVGNSSK